MKTFVSPSQFSLLTKKIKSYGLDLGFQQVGITDTDLRVAEHRLQQWLAQNYHGSMKYMAEHGNKRSRPAELIANTLRIISVRMDYLPPNPLIAKILANPKLAFISRYALGRDYHKLLRKRLEKLAQMITAEIGEFSYRVFTDSAPVMEKPLAEKAGLGWIGKSTNLINNKAGSYFFLGTIYTDLALPIDTPATDHCGRCKACIDICPTKAIVAPYQLDARRCISYLTIESRDAIPVELRPLIGNRIYGCDDCMLICPWNKYAKTTTEVGFHPRHNLHHIDLIELFSWTETEFYQKTAGSPIRRIGYECWLRNIAVALGNAPYSQEIIAALNQKLTHPSPLVQEHTVWALERQETSMDKPLNIR